MKTIMIVDNNKNIMGEVKVILEKSGYKVIEASSGKKCLKKLETTKPDLILMDIIMPGMSGWDTVTEIKKNKKWNKIKICFLSVVETSEERKKALKDLGIDGYIMKPCSKKCLLEEVKKLIS